MTLAMIEAPYWEPRRAWAPQQGELLGRGVDGLSCPRCGAMTLYRTEWESEETVDECDSCRFVTAYPTGR